MQNINDIQERYQLHINEARKLRKILFRTILRNIWETQRAFFVRVLSLSFLLMIILFFSSALAEKKEVKSGKFTRTAHNFIKIKRSKIQKIQEPMKTHEEFLHKLGFMESGNNYQIVNQYGYMGRYQIGRLALTTIGMDSVTQEDFLANPQLQELAQKLILKKNKSILKGWIKKYQGKVIGGIYITESGILGAAQMAAKGVIDFLKSNGSDVFKDGNGTPITKYLRAFSNYKLNI